jgi:TonB family protein
MKKYCPQCSMKYSDGQQRFCQRDGSLLSLLDPYRLVGSTLETRYRIEALVGIGGFGAVYRAQQLGTGRAVAFKILRPDVALQVPEADGLFEGEAKTAARLEHENIVTIYDAGHTADGLSFIAMEWLEGRTLDGVLKTEGRFSLERTLEVLRPVVAALAYAHAQRVVHRDLKPANVMLCRRRNGSELVKVVDFGIAKVMSSSAGSTISRSLGTPHYSPPEQWTRGAQIDGRVDIYALGVLLFELLTRQLPFDATSIEELIQLKLSDPPPALRTVWPAAPAALEALLQRMMAPAPARRPQLVSEVPALFEAACKSDSQAQIPTLIGATEWISGTEIKQVMEQPASQPMATAESHQPTDRVILPTQTAAPANLETQAHRSTEEETMGSFVGSFGQPLFSRNIRITAALTLTTLLTLGVFWVKFSNQDSMPAVAQLPTTAPPPASAAPSGQGQVSEAVKQNGLPQPAPNTPASTPQIDTPKQIKVSGMVLQGSAITKVQPTYPIMAKAAKVSGVVQVQITISEEGRVIEASVLNGHALLREASLQAARQWVFKPTELSGVPVKVQGILTFNFELP